MKELSLNEIEQVSGGFLLLMFLFIPEDTGGMEWPVTGAKP
ncbi:hypothetical protein [uncultured Ferrimonas sp.]|nr:hypothetical protein [uncultured Ferrimonas sp.]